MTKQNKEKQANLTEGTVKMIGMALELTAQAIEQGKPEVDFYTGMKTQDVLRNLKKSIEGMLE